MYKLNCGAAIGAWRAFEATKADAAYNWNRHDLLGVDKRYIWPMIDTGQESLEGYALDPDAHVMWFNEPMPTAALARRINALQLDRYMRWLNCTHVVGNFLIQAGLPGKSSWDDISDGVLAFWDALECKDSSVLGIHLYREEIDLEPEAYTEWIHDELESIAERGIPFAVTEYGVLKVMYRSGYGVDVERLQSYMKRGWWAMDDLDCYAASWFMTISDEHRRRGADFVACDPDGTLRPLGHTWAALESEFAEPSEPNEPEPLEAWATVWENADMRLQQRVNGKTLTGSEWV